MVWFISQRVLCLFLSVVLCLVDGEYGDTVYYHRFSLPAT